VTGAKLVVIYPRPLDEEAFERAYRDEHTPMIEQKLKGVSRFVATKVLSSPQGRVAAYRLAELHFASMDELRKATESEAGKELMEHAKKISTGGIPIVLVCEEQTYFFW
jgi:uncharacterized protein (TIGR02118 family)